MLLDRRKPTFHCITGTICVGKSTIFERLEKYFWHLNILNTEYNVDVYHPRGVFIKEAARQIFQDHPDLNRAAPNTQKFILDVQMHAEGLYTKRQDKALHVFADRCLIDTLAWARFYKNSVGHDTMYQQVRAWAYLNYDFVYVCMPDGIELQNDAQRVETALVRQTYHEILIELLNDLDVPYKELYGNENQRVSNILGDVYKSAW